MAEQKSNYNFEVVSDIGTLSQSSKGWKKMVKYLSWNGKEPKYDIREWSPDDSKMGKGVTLSKEEMKALKDLLQNLDLD